MTHLLNLLIGVGIYRAGKALVVGLRLPRIIITLATIAAFALGLVIFKAADFRCRPSDNTLKIGGVLMAGCNQVAEISR